MARGSTLATLIALLKAELRDAQEANTTLDIEYGYALASKQKDLSLMYDWPFLRHDWDLTCVAGSRYLIIPTTDTRAQSVVINFERPILVQRKWASSYVEITYGIGPEEYNLYEGVSERQDPIQRWQFSTNVNETSNPNEIEIWPSPAGTQILRFSGQRVVKALSSVSDTCDLDDFLLVYYVAADYLMQREQSNAPLVLKKANDHLVRLRSSYPERTIPRKIIGRRSHLERENIKLIAVA